jgi:hypothetical protein
MGIRTGTEGKGERGLRTGTGTGAYVFGQWVGVEMETEMGIEKL